MKDLDFRLLMSRLLEGWRTLAVAGALGATFAVMTLPFQRPVYSVQMTVVPAPSEQAGSGSASASGSLISTLGLSDGTNSTYTRYQRLLVSPVVAQRMEDRYGMLRYVFRSNWNVAEKKWEAHTTIHGMLTGWLLRLAHVPTWSPPEATTLANYLSGALLIVPSTQSDIVTITMNDADVSFAKRVMLTAHEQANAVLRDQVARRARQQVAYLQKKLSDTTVEDYRAALISILSNQEKTLMLTQTDASYAAEILSPPSASPTPISPRPVLYVFVAILEGMIVGAALVIFFGANWWRAAMERLRITPRETAPDLSSRAPRP